jgi:hypothetical protein
MQSTKLLLLATTLCLTAWTAHAATITWTGGGASGVWADAANWDTAIPVAEDTALLNTAVTFTDFDGQSVGEILGGTTNNIEFIGNGNFTFDNGASAAVITSRNFQLENATFNFDQLTIDSDREITKWSNATLNGDLLTVNYRDWGWKHFSSVMNINTLDLSSSTNSRLRAINTLPIVDGVTVNLGENTIRADFPGDASYLGLNGANLVMDQSYALFESQLGTVENIELASWEINGQLVPIGTYNQSSSTSGDFDYGLIFQNDNTTSFTVIPEPSTLMLVGMSIGLLAFLRKRGK